MMINSIPGKAVAILAIALALAPPIAAQDTGAVTGRLTDRQSGAPVADAVVTVEGTGASALSDAAGRFFVRNVQAGRHELRVERTGYALVSRSVVISPGETMTVDIALTAAALAVDAVTAVGESRAQTEMREVRQSPFSVTVIDAQRLAGRGLTLDEALQRVTGVQVRRSGGLGSASVFNVRGLEGQRVQIYVDGNAANVVGDSFSLDDLPVQLIERIEVYKGVVPARFGGDGLGAAINVVSRKPDGGYTDLGYTAGSFGQHQFAGIAKRPVFSGIDVAGILNVDVAANDYTMESPFIPGLSIRRDHDSFRRVLAAGAIETDRLWFDDLEFVALTIASRREIQGIQTNVQHAEAESTLRALVVEGDRQGALGGRLDLRTAAIALFGRNQLIDTSSVRYSFTGEPYPSPNGRGELGLLPSDSDNGRDFFRHRAAATYRLSHAHTANLTYVLDYSRYEPRDTLANQYAGRNVSEFPGEQKSAVFGLSHEWRSRNERFINVAGVRGYAFRSEGTPSNLNDPSAERPPPVTNQTTSVGASEAIRYFITPEILVKASVELARRLPVSTELFGDGQLIQPAPGLRPERSVNLNVGAQSDHALVGNRRFQAEFNVFHMRLRDMIRLTQGYAGTAAHTNMGAVHITGFDSEVKLDVTRWLYGSVGLTFQDARDRLELLPNSVVPNPTEGLRLPNMPWLFGNVLLEAHGADLLGRDQQTRVFYDAGFTEEYFYAFEVSQRQERRVPRSFTHTLGIEQQWRARGLTVSAEVQNITGARVLNQFNQPLPGRMIRAKLRYTRINHGDRR